MFRGTNSLFRRLYSQGCASAQLGARPNLRCYWTAGWWHFQHCLSSVTTYPDKTRRRHHTTIFKNRMNVFYIKVYKISISGNLGSERLTTLFYNLPVRQAEYSILAATKVPKRTARTAWHKMSFQTESHSLKTFRSNYDNTQINIPVTINFVLLFSCLYFCQFSVSCHLTHLLILYSYYYFVQGPIFPYISYVLRTVLYLISRQ